MPPSTHICAPSMQWSTSTTACTPHLLSKSQFLSLSSSTPISTAVAPFSYLSTHETPSIHVPMSNIRDSSREKMEIEEDDFNTLPNSDLMLLSAPFSATQTPTTTTQAFSNDSSTATTPPLNIYTLPPPNTKYRFIFKIFQNIEYTNEDTTDSESISDVGHNGHHRQLLPPPRIYFHESLLEYVPPFCSDLLPRDPEVKSVPRNYRSWIRAGRPRLEVDGATRNEAKNDLSSIGLAWHGSGNGDSESESELSDGKGEDKEKRRRKKKKLPTRRNAVPTILVERPKRNVRRIAEADGQLRMVVGSTRPSPMAVATVGALEKTADRFDSSRAQSLAQSSVPSSRAQSPAKKRKSTKLDAGAEHKMEADAQVDDEERDADGSEDDDVDADGEVDPDVLVTSIESQFIDAVGQDGAGAAVRIAAEMPVPEAAHKAMSESSSVTLIDAGSADDVDALVAGPPKITRKRKRITVIGDEENATREKLSEVDAKKARISPRKGRTKSKDSSASMPFKTTKSAIRATPLKKLRSRPIRRVAVPPNNTLSEPARLSSNVSNHETEEEQDSEQDDDKDETFLPDKVKGEVVFNRGSKALRTPKPKVRSSRASSGVEGIPPLPSARSTRTTRRLGETSPAISIFDAANSSGSESKGNGVFTSGSISRPHHRATQPTSPIIPIPMRTFDPPLPMIEGYSGFYRRYPLILQFDTGSATFEAESGSASKKVSSFGDMEKYVLDGVPRELVPNPKRPLGNFNPPRDIRDLYTPRYTKGSGGKKLALCPICLEDPRRGGEGRQEWNHTKTSQHNYHMQYYHGISASRFQPFSPPIAHRVIQVPRPQSNEKPEILQGKCHHCKQWIPLEGCKVGELKVKELFWWKHAACCHKDSKLPGDKDIFIEDVAYQRLLAFEAQHGIDPEVTA